MKAIALISGGLDSILAARCIKEQGIEVVALNFCIPFYSCRKAGVSGDKFSLVREALGQELKTVDISREFLEMFQNPGHGLGSNMNPCIDCKILMLSKARELMRELEAGFIVTGEVLGQRPMSQHRQALDIIEKKSGLPGFLLRPLSAKYLAETVPEKQSWVNREKLLNFSGRTRKPQIELAKYFKIRDYPNAAGGCLLTDPGFSSRLKDIIEHKQLDLRNIELIKVGRHFRLSDNAKLIIGRNEKENERLSGLAQEGEFLFSPKETAGPTCLGAGDFDDDLLELACGIASRYCDRDENSGVEISFGRAPGGFRQAKSFVPAEESVISRYRI